MSQCLAFRVDSVEQAQVLFLARQALHWLSHFSRTSFPHLDRVEFVTVSTALHPAVTYMTETDDNVAMPYSTFPLHLCFSNFRVWHHCLEHPLRQGTDSYFKFLISGSVAGLECLALTGAWVIFTWWSQVDKPCSCQTTKSPLTQSPLGLCVAVYEVISFQTLRC